MCKCFLENQTGFMHFFFCLSVYISMEDFLATKIARCLPLRVLSEISRVTFEKGIRPDEINEVRLRACGCASVTCRGENFLLDGVLSESDINECVTKLCHGSLYAYSESVRRGYIALDGGVRVGICGTLSPDGRALSAITSLNIRIPHIIRGVSGKAIEFCTRGGRLQSALIYSPPGGGKTTLLRDMASKLAARYRVALIDTRSELWIPEMFSGTMCDALVGYAKADGIETATRTLSPELIVCDEIGGTDEARQILSSAMSGVPIIASAHASSAAELISRQGIRLLHEEHVFSGYIGIRRERINGRLARSYIFDFSLREDMD